MMRVFQNFVILWSLFFVNFSYGQPQLETKKTVEGVIVYKDAKNPRLYYYEPGELALSYHVNGKPDFQFLDLRYTGTKCSNDIGAKNFMSLVQFGIELKGIASEKLMRLKKSLGSVKVKPLSISAIATRLILPKTTKEDNPSKPIGIDGTTQAEDASGYSTSDAYWSKRYFTTRLDTYESQLLNDQLTNGLLGMSLSYSFYVKMIPPKEAIAEGSSEIKEMLDEPENSSPEELLQNILIKSNTLPIEVDLKKYPDAIKQIDLNEDIPPSYAAIEVKCYDFAYEATSDIYMKMVEIEAESVNRNNPVSVTLRFTKKDTETYTRFVNFPYAVQMDKPMRYRISEISMMGEKHVFDWVDKPDCTSVIDISRKEKDQKTETFTLDLEINDALLAEENNQSFEVVFSYFLKGKKEQQIATFNLDDATLKTLIFNKDKNSSITYHILIKHTDKSTQKIEEKTVDDNFIYINTIE